MVFHSGTLHEVLAPTDPAIVEVAAGGERLVARMRVLFYGAIWLIPLVTVIALRDPLPEVTISFVASSGALLTSILFVILVRRTRVGAGVAFATTTFDVSLVTLTLAAVALAGRTEVAINSQIVWPVYLLAILATSFRFDYRVCALAGALSIAQYLLLVFWVVTRWHPGDVNWPVQIGRLLLQATAMALAIGLVNQGRRLAHVSGRDRLTGLGNRAMFEETLDVELARAARSGQPLSLAFLDIDHFKRFNDSFGHETGDAALRAVAQVLQNSSRVTDRAFRWGGEELIAVLPATDRAGAFTHLDRLRAVLRETSLPNAGDVRITVSVGIAEYPADGESAEALIAAADSRLLTAKRGGRDRVEAAA